MALAATLLTRAEPAFASDAVAVIPLPREVVRMPGTFVLPNAVTIGARSAVARDVAAVAASALRRLGVVPSLRAAHGAAATIRLTDGAHDPSLGDEGYRLDVDATGVAIRANVGAGLFYGVQTLAQLASPDGRAAAALPYVRIVDRPEFRWRGFHLDVSRHFFPVDAVERSIDLAARFKLNTFHWHLTDDQGWRVEIRSHPRLATVGGCRAGTQVAKGSPATDSVRVCGYYTQQQVAEVVRYAAARYVTVVPEIEGPGHSIEVLAAYPSLACAPGTFATRTTWGSSRYGVLCPTEATFALFDDVIREVAGMFPGPVIHIGGDEVSPYAWRASAYVMALMRREHIATYAGVQRYFAARVEAIARRYGRRPAGWDEISGADAAHDAVILAWRNQAAGASAARAGNDVVMAVQRPLYFDAYQGLPRYEPPAIGHYTTLEMVYAYDPVAGFTPQQRSHVLGAQGNLWTEYVPTVAQFDYMAYPRMLALAELCWTPRALMRWSGFSSRLAPALARLDADGVAFRIPEVRLAAASAGSDTVLTMRALVAGAAIRYTMDGSLPTALSALYTAPLRLRGGGAPVHVTATAVLLDRRSSAPAFLDVDSHHENLSPEPR